jgi:hypothetical protein
MTGRAMYQFSARRALGAGTGIPTFAFGKTTDVQVNCTVAGSIHIQAGGSPAETDSCVPGNNQFVRNFGGVLPAVTNKTSGNITVTTH